MSTYSEIDRSDPRRLQRHLNALTPEQRYDRFQMLEAVLRRQLAVRLECDVTDDSGSDPGSGPRGVSFRRLLVHPNPPAEMLERIKQFAKASRTVPGGALPVEVAGVLYFASISAALLRCRTRITSLDDQAIGEGVDWCLAQPWLDPALRSLFEQMRLCLQNMAVAS